MYIDKPRDIGNVIKELYEKQGLSKELIADFLNIEISDLNSFEDGYHVVNAFDLERLCALFCCKLHPYGVDMSNYKALDIEKPLDKLQAEDLDVIVSSHLKVSELIYVPQV